MPSPWLLPLAVVAAACSAPVTPSPDAGPARCEDTTPWAAAPPLPLGATQETAALHLDGKLYVLGGFNGRLGITGEVQVFDLASCTWSAGPALPAPLHHANAAVVGDTLYVLGSLAELEFVPDAAAWSWAPAREATWSALPPMPAAVARGSAAVGAIGRRIYLAGGLAGRAVATLSSYDVDTRTWTAELAPLPVARDHACGAVVGDRLYVLGGRQTTTSSVSGTVYEYTPGGAWRARASMPTPRGGVACGVVGDRIIVAGGEGNPANAAGIFSQVEAYSPATDSWQSLPALPTPRHGMAAAGAGARLLIPGGATRAGFAATATFEILTP